MSRGIARTTTVHSSKAQLARAKLWSEDEGSHFVDAFEEIDVSGKLPLVPAAGRRALTRGLNRQ